MYRHYVDKCLKKMGMQRLVIRLRDIFNCTLQRAREALESPRHMSDLRRVMTNCWKLLRLCLKQITQKSAKHIITRHFIHITINMPPVMHPLQYTLTCSFIFPFLMLFFFLSHLSVHCSFTCLRCISLEYSVIILSLVLLLAIVLCVRCC